MLQWVQKVIEWILTFVMRMVDGSLLDELL